MQYTTACMYKYPEKTFPEYIITVFESVNEKITVAYAHLLDIMADAVIKRLDL